MEAKKYLQIVACIALASGMVGSSDAGATTPADCWTQATQKARNCFVGCCSSPNFCDPSCATGCLTKAQGWLSKQSVTQCTQTTQTKTPR